jgi:hypothetical protein
LLDKCSTKWVKTTILLICLAYFSHRVLCFFPGQLQTMVLLFLPTDYLLLYAWTTTQSLSSFPDLPPSRTDWSFPLLLLHWLQWWLIQT